ncbi:MAG: ribbon-helix-helix domain-containing protein [Hyphomicrobiaceae bacterium]|nr:ribbon-helix-helix domain-containing protein [Hyphomicrobiaceae bacterium]
MTAGKSGAGKKSMKAVATDAVREKGAAGKAARAKDSGRAKALKAALKEVSGERPRRNVEPVVASAKLAAKDRQELRGYVIYLNDEAKAQLSRLAIDQRRTAQDLGVEAINLLFRRYRLVEIA